MIKKFQTGMIGDVVTIELLFTQADFDDDRTKIFLGKFFKKIT